MAKGKGPKGKGRAEAIEIPEGQPSVLIAYPEPRKRKVKHPWVPDGKLVVQKCQQLERRVFPKSEAMEIQKELDKPNQYLYTVVECNNDNSNETKLLAYGVLALMKIDCTARITKICTDPGHRNKGFGTMLVKSMIESVTRSPSSPFIDLDQFGYSMEIRGIQLHVDSDRPIAIKLYNSCGFYVKTQIPDYYAPGRDALLMSNDI